MGPLTLEGYGAGCTKCGPGRRACRATRPRGYVPPPLRREHGPFVGLFVNLPGTAAPMNRLRTLLIGSAAWPMTTIRGRGQWPARRQIRADFSGTFVPHSLVTLDHLGAVKRPGILEGRQ